MGLNVLLASVEIQFM